MRKLKVESILAVQYAEQMDEVVRAIAGMAHLRNVAITREDHRALEVVCEYEEIYKLLIEQIKATLNYCKEYQTQEAPK